MITAMFFVYLRCPNILKFYGAYHKNLKNSDTIKFAVNTLKFEQGGFTIV